MFCPRSDRSHYDGMTVWVMTWYPHRWVVTERGHRAHKDKGWRIFHCAIVKVGGRIIPDCRGVSITSMTQPPWHIPLSWHWHWPKVAPGGHHRPREAKALSVLDPHLSRCPGCLALVSPDLSWLCSESQAIKECKVNTAHIFIGAQPPPTQPTLDLPSIIPWTLHYSSFTDRNNSKGTEFNKISIETPELWDVYCWYWSDTPGVLFYTLQTN